MKKSKKLGLRVRSLNVGTMTGKATELIDIMQRRKVDILCVQETAWKGSKTRSFGAFNLIKLQSCFMMMWMERELE